MALVSKEWIQGFHDAEGDGLDPCPLVEAAWIAHQLLEEAKKAYGLLSLLVDMAEQPEYLQEKKERVRQEIASLQAAINKATASEGAI